MAQSRKPGRPAGPLAGDTPEAEELAKWVSAVTKALTLRELEERFQYGRTQWGQFRKGSKVLPSWLVDDLVRVLVKPSAQQVQLQLGQRLQKAAEAAAVAREAQSGSVPMGTEVELQLRLDQARKATIEAQKTLLGTTQVIYMLLQLVTSLQSRCQALERERDRATEQATSSDRVQRELVETRQKVAAARKKLKRARRTREEAEELNVTAEVTAARHEMALESMRSASLEAPDSSRDQGENTSSAAAADTSSVVDELRPLWEYDADLEAADQQMEAHEAELDELRAQMGLDAPQTHGHILQGVVVHEDPADNRAVPKNSGGRHNEPGPAVEEAVPPNTPMPAFTRPIDAPRDITEVANPAVGRLCLGALYVPETQGVRLHFGLLNGKPVGLIAEIVDYQFEIRLRVGTRNKGSWNSLYFHEASEDLAKRGPVGDWDGRDQLLPGWGQSAATQYSISSTVGGSKQQYQVIVTGCDGPGWVLQLTCFRPLEFKGSAWERSTFRVLRAVLRDSVIDPSGRLESGHYILERPISRPATRRVAPEVEPSAGASVQAPATGKSSSALSADSADKTASRANSVRTASTDKTRPKRRTVPAPRWVAVKDTLTCLTMLGWTGSLAAGLTYRRWDNTGPLEYTLTTAWAVALFLVAVAICLPLMAMGNFTRTREGEERAPSGTSCLVVTLTILTTLVCVIIASLNPELLPLLDDWGQTLSNTLLA
ncbi:DUF3710 domain-containing protein [Streptomyces pilosus]|uniref:DUF3710 domain-containing protein n=1 Tax=Streptomyces pilosus TaxID=28893 RepID=UPI003641E7A2